MPRSPSNSRPQAQERKIGNAKANSYVANGVARHRPTKVAPESLLEGPSDEVLRGQLDRHLELADTLRGILGQPYCIEPGFILYNGDCTAILEELRKKNIQAQLTVTSPPYNIGKEYESSLSCSEYVDWCEGWIKQIYNVTSPQGSFWLNVGFFEVPDRGLCVPIPYLLWDKSDFYFLQEIVWAYGAGVSAKHRFSPRNEKWLYYVRDNKNYIFNLDDIRDPNVKYPNQMKNGKFRCNPLGKNPSDVWEFPKVTTGTRRSSKERSGHPAQFPLGIVERIVRASSNVYDLILDPFAGSCSTGIAAAGSGRLFIGVEIRSDYCELAASRYRNFLKTRAAIQNHPTLF